MPSLKDNFGELLERVRSGRELGHASFEPIYYLIFHPREILEVKRNLPAWTAKLRNDGWDVHQLSLADEIDEIVIPSLGKYKDIELKAVNRSDAGEDLKSDEDKEKSKAAVPVAEKIKKALGDRVKDVKVSIRLSDSPSCIVTDESDPTYQMQAMMRQMGRGMEMPEVKPILEINPDHAIVTGLKDVDDEERIADVAVLLLDQALLLEGVELKDAADFVKRLNKVLARGL